MEDSVKVATTNIINVTRKLILYKKSPGIRPGLTKHYNEIIS